MAFMKQLLSWNICGWSTLRCGSHTPATFVLRVVSTLSFALADVLIIDTTLLSSHCKARTGGSLSHRIAPVSCPFFAAFQTCREFSPGFKGSACVKDSPFIQVAGKSDRRIEFITKKMIPLALIVQHKFANDIIP